MTTTSKEYAEALFELALQQNLTKETADGLETVESALLQQPEYRNLLASPAIGKEERLQAVDDAFRGKVPDILLVLLRMMVSRGHMTAFDGMVRYYEDLSREYRGESVANVTSAVPLKESEAVALRQLLEKRFSRNITLNCTIDPKLIGGVRVEVDGRVIDGSIRTKLEQMREVMYS